MALKSLSLFNFRNYSKVSFQFSSSLNLIVGPNAVGKTNLLEAVYLLATGNSFRALKNEQMINWNQQLAIAEAKVGERELKISLQKENQRTKKEFWVDKIKKTRRQFLDSFSAVIFRPEEIRVITSSPSRRRDFLNDILLPLDWQYRQAVLAYEKALRRRNRVLLEISEGKAGQQELFYWNQALAKNGEIIYQGRKKFVDFVNQFFNISQEKRFNHLSCQYLVNPISLTILDQNLTEDLKQGVTTAGPHRDDFSLLNSRFGAEEKDLASWGSRGQYRLAILALKLAQLAFIKEKKQEKPILLLDDIFSELDEKSQKLVSSLLENYQILLTSTEEINLPFSYKVINL